MMPQGRGFVTTQWNIVQLAGQATGASEPALARLCEAYWYPVYAFIRRQGVRPDDARDLTQAFFAVVLEKNYFADADQARGRFRTFLLASVSHFLSKERRRQRAEKRGGGHQILSLEMETAEGRYQIDPPDEVTPEKVFDRQWALVVLDRTLARVRAQHAAVGKADQFDRLKALLVGDEELSYAAVASQADMSEGALRVAVYRLRRQCREALVEEIGSTVGDPEAVTAEIRYLMDAVA